ncbi:MAG: dihydrolipoamide acetyltransferase [Proteobacteria bacterium]|nr:dihydrolipoamide acetyltransferase [Pseudomonadota bacterium]
MHLVSTAAAGRVSTGRAGYSIILSVLLASIAFAFAASGAWAQPAQPSTEPAADGQDNAAEQASSGGDAGQSGQSENGGSKPADPAKADAAATGQAGSGADAAGPASPTSNPGIKQGPADPATSTMPVNLRLRRLEQRVQALKERAWRAKARVGMLKEAVLGGGVGANATIVHKNKMGGSFRLVKLVYALDGTQIFARSDDSGALHKNKEFEVLTGPIAPGSHTISVLALYRGHGYGVFKYLTKYKFTVRSSHTFTASEGKSTRIEAVAFEKGGPTTPLEDRPAIDFKVSYGKGTAEK